MAGRRKFRQVSFTVSRAERTMQAMYVSRNIEARSCNHCCCGKAISITYSEFIFLALGIEHASCMGRIVICGLSGSTVFFPTLSYKRQDLGTKVIEHVYCSSQRISSETFIILSGTW